MPLYAKELVAINRPLIRDMRRLPFLRRAANGNLPAQSWYRFAIERYHSARLFVPLIQKGEEICRAFTDENGQRLHKAFFDNLQDEMGLSVPGAGSHESWRLDMYGAMGITAETLAQGYENDGTAYYARMLRQMIDEADIFVISGALLFLEAAIPHEYVHILKGVEQDFPEQFDLSLGETPARLKARRYLVDHIEHDNAVHARDLYVALGPYIADPAVLAKLHDGAQRAFTARSTFYADLYAGLPAAA